MTKFEGLSHYENTLVNRHINATVEAATSRRLLLAAGLTVDLQLTEHTQDGKMDLLLISDLSVTKKIKPEGETPNEK